MRCRSFSTVCLLLALAAGGSLLAGCVSRPKENASAGELLVLGQEDLKAERFERAREAFKRILRLYPDSKHRRDALLNLGDSYFKAQEYIAAKVQYSEFVQLYPISRKTPRAYYYLGMSDFNQILDFDRDQESARESLKSFNILLKRFPKSDYAVDGKKKSRKLRRLIAAHELFIARFYLKQGFPVSAIPRLREFVKEYHDIPDLRAEAMYYLGEGYRTEESLEKAGVAYRNLVTDHPDSTFAKEAYERLLVLTGRNSGESSSGFRIPFFSKKPARR